MHRVPEGLTHEMPSGGQREGLLIPTLLDSPGQDPPPTPRVWAWALPPGASRVGLGTSTESISAL